MTRQEAIDHARKYHNLGKNPTDEDCWKSTAEGYHTYIPDPVNKEVYERNYSVFKGLYKANAGSFRKLNA